MTVIVLLDNDEQQEHWNVKMVEFIYHEQSVILTGVRGTELVIKNVSQCIVKP